MIGLARYDIFLCGLGGALMTEIQGTRCHTRYRIDERVLPDDTPTFKCSRCGHVFNADPVPAKQRTPAPTANEQATWNDSQPAQTLRPPRPPASAPAAPAERRSVIRETVAPARAAEPDFNAPPQRQPDAQQFESLQPHIDRQIPQPAASESNGGHELGSDHPLNTTFGG